MRKICLFFMTMDKKAKLNFYLIRLETDFIVFLRKIQNDEKVWDYRIALFDVIGLLWQCFGADLFR